MAAAGIDAISHALESHVTRTRSERSAELSAEAWRLLNRYFDASLNGHDDPASLLEARGHMLVGAHLAGVLVAHGHAGPNPGAHHHRRLERVRQVVERVRGHLARQIRERLRRHAVDGRALHADPLRRQVAGLARATAEA